MKKKGMSICLSFGRFGGFYINRGYSTRICLGFMAITIFPEDIDDILDRLSDKVKLPVDKASLNLTEYRLEIQSGLVTEAINDIITIVNLNENPRPMIKDQFYVFPKDELK